MTYQETIHYLFNSTPVFEHVGQKAYKEGLDNTLALDEHFGHPHTKFRTIHVAGTNGKGSCSHTLASILQADGYKVGLYTSPHLVDFRERIKINGKCISEDYVIDFVERERNFFEPLQPSFFELTTALAFKYFAENKVDFAIIEVGLGGRLDCTNIIHPLLSIITNISFDHTQLLGNTLHDIAIEKAGIIKQGTPVVIGESVPETRVVFESTAQRKDALILFAEDMPLLLNSTLLSSGRKHYKTKYFGEFDGDLIGLYQDKNTNTVLTACQFLYNRGIIRNAHSVGVGFGQVSATTGLLGRWQVLNQQPLTVCDTGHNVGGWKYLSQQIKTQACHHRHIIFGMVDDKDIDTVMSMLPQEAFYYWTQPSSSRAFPVELVAAHAQPYHLSGACYSTVKEAYQAAITAASKTDFIFIGGSSYVVADLLTFLQ